MCWTALMQTNTNNVNNNKQLEVKWNRILVLCGNRNGSQRT